jgi:alkylated DNA repair dioxygenase AlkB
MTPQDTIDSFDMDYCRCYWTPSSGIVYSEGCKVSIETKIIKRQHWDIMPKRVWKALRYGYKFPDEYFRYRNYLVKTNKRTDITVEDFNMDLIKTEPVTLTITDRQDLYGTLHELARQYQELLYEEGSIEAPVLLSFGDFKTNERLIDRYVVAIILINPMSEARYQDIRMGENFVQRYRREENVGTEEDFIVVSDDDMDPNYYAVSDGEHPDATNNSTYTWDAWTSPIRCVPQRLSLPVAVLPIEPSLPVAVLPIEPSLPVAVLPTEPSLPNTTKTIEPIYGRQQMIQLNESGTAYISIDHLPEALLAQIDFDGIYALHPEEKHKIIMYENEVPVHRYSKSYLNTPCELSHTVTRSYMYSGLNTDENTDPLPDLLTPIYDHMKRIDPKYNQVICNWYDNDQDYIAPHSDCQRQMISAARVALVSLYEPIFSGESGDNNYRILELTPKAGTRSLVDKFVIRLNHGSIVTMCGATQDEFVHGIPIHPTPCGRRISVSFRQMRDSDPSNGGCTSSV